MNILVLENITKGFGDRTLLDHVSLGINEGDKIGVIGINGTGKSTLLKIIAGLEETDEGTVTKGNQVTVAYLPQTPVFDEDSTILAHVLKGKIKGSAVSASSNRETDRDHWTPEDWTTESDAKTILNKLGFSDYDLPTGPLSGGEKKRVALARTLLNPAEVLILDEPTNHLDSDMVLWLEQYLQKYKGVLIMVTHDRYFLDRVTNKILEIDEAKLYSYEANYSGFLELREQRLADAMASERKRQSILRTELEWLHRGARARSTKQKAHIQRIEEMQSVSAPTQTRNVEMDSVGTRMGKKTIEIEGVAKGFGDRRLFSDFSYIVLKNERIGIIGPNGCGKSTLMKIITGLEEPDEGLVTLGDTIRIGYFSQENEDMDGDTRVIDYIRDVAEIIHTSRGVATASQMLERFLFPPITQYTPVNKLSGGEKRRLYLLRVLMSAPNVLILDEPTNDLDIATLTILEDYLDHFNGIVITVSHDRYFLDRICERIFAFEDGRIRQYEGGYTDYFNSPNRPRVEENVRKPGTYHASQDTVAANTGKGGSAPATSPASGSVKPRTAKLKFSYKEQREFETIDDDIAELEGKIAEKEAEIDESSSNYSKLNELMAEKEKLETQLEEKMDRWVYLNDLAEQIANQ